MNEEQRQENIESQAISVEQDFKSAKSKIFPILLTTGVIVLLIITALSIIYYNSKAKTANQHSFDYTTPQIQDDLSDTDQRVQNNSSSGANVDHAIYLELQDLMSKTQLAQPEVVEESLRGYDIDGDGDEDVLGFLKLTFSPDNSNYLFTTWFRYGEKYDYFEDAYHDFRYGGRFEDEITCSIDSLKFKNVTLACVDSGQEYKVTLNYQKNGFGGYYRDVDAQAVSFNREVGWRQYISVRGGPSFNYPSDVSVSEKTYDINGQLITVIIGVRDEETLFEIHSVPSESSTGGGLIDLSWQGVFLKLSEGSYLSRNLMIPKTDFMLPGVFYRKTESYRENDSGAIFASYDAQNFEKGRDYTFFTPLTNETDLKDVDNIFASLTFKETPAAQDSSVVSVKNNSLSLAGVVTLTVPGNISEKAISSGSITAGKELEISLIDSPIYQPSPLRLVLYPFQSVGGTNSLGGGGYDLEKDGCFLFDKKEISEPQKIGENLVCKFGWGDAGISTQGYYVLDPNRNYILSVSRNAEYSGLYASMLSPKLEDIVSSVHFSTK